MATNEQVAAWLKSNPTASDAQIASLAKEAGVSAAQLAAVTGLTEADVTQRLAAAPAYVAPPTQVAAPTGGGLLTSPVAAPAASAPTGPSYKDYTGSSDYLGKIIDQVNSGDAKVITSRNVPGYISYGETDENIPMFRPFSSEEEGGGTGRPATKEELAQAKYNENRERFELTAPVTVSPYIDLSKNPINGLDKWPVSAAGNGAYKLSSMNNSETDYANVLFQPDASGKAKITEANPVSFEKYDKGNFFSNLAGAVGDFASSDAAKLLAAGAGAMYFGPGLLSGAETAAAAGGAGAGGAGGAGGLTALDAMGANMVTGALPGAGALGAIPTALDVTGANMVTGQMAGVAPTVAGGVAAATPSLFDTAKTALTSLTPSQISTIAKTGLALAGTAGAVNALPNTGGGLLTPTATDRSGVSSGTANYSPEYYAALQASYNKLMPATAPQQPRDVTTDLKKWYESKYAPSTMTNKVI